MNTLTQTPAQTATLSPDRQFIVAMFDQASASRPHCARLMEHQRAAYLGWMASTYREAPSPWTFDGVDDDTSEIADLAYSLGMGCVIAAYLRGDAGHTMTDPLAETPFTPLAELALAALLKHAGDIAKARACPELRTAHKALALLYTALSGRALDNQRDTLGIKTPQVTHRARFKQASQEVAFH